MIWYAIENVEGDCANGAGKRDEAGLWNTGREDLYYTLVVHGVRVCVECHGAHGSFTGPVFEEFHFCKDCFLTIHVRCSASHWLYTEWVCSACHGGDD
jgi:hypothetical protein